jgi:NADH-quinone oxidoreductase subunit C
MSLGNLKKVLPNLIKKDQLICEISAKKTLEVASILQQQGFDYLLDLCVVDYLCYGVSQWDTQGSTQGFSRAQVQPVLDESDWRGSRFVVVCHFLSLAKKERLRLKISLDDDLTMPSLTNIWPCANWYEREAFDLFGVLFTDHPNLNRILTDYGFVGHPMRKDFPQIGHVELRYDGETESCVYEPVTIEARVSVPKVVRKDNRYVENE